MLCLSRETVKNSGPKLRSSFIFVELEKAFEWVPRKLFVFEG